MPGTIWDLAFLRGEEEELTLSELWEALPEDRFRHVSPPDAPEPEPEPATVGQTSPETDPALASSS